MSRTRSSSQVFARRWSEGAANDHVQKGLSLIELMVAMVLALLVLSAVAWLFAGSSNARNDVERSGRLGENAAYATELLSEEVRLAGYYAEMTWAGVSWNVPDPCATALGGLGWSHVPFTAPPAIVGYEPADATPNCIPDRKPGTGMVVLRRVSAETTPVAQASGAPFLQVSKCNTDPAAWVFSNNKADFTLRNLDCVTLADIRELVVRTYYIGCDNACAAGTVPTLKRAELVGNEIVITSLVDGVEDLELEYGFDTDNDGDPDIYRVGLSGTAGAADNDWSNVMSARLYVRVRTTDAPPGEDDSSKSYLTPAGYVVPTGPDTAYKRVNLVGVVRLVNPSGWRELP
ncbi:MAG TPA: PilW family protein [Casimicrobiaceae bacterium]